MCVSLCSFLQYAIGLSGRPLRLYKYVVEFRITSAYWFKFKSFIEILTLCTFQLVPYIFHHINLLLSLGRLDRISHWPKGCVGVLEKKQWWSGVNYQLAWLFDHKQCSIISLRMYSTQTCTMFLHNVYPVSQSFLVDIL